MERENSRERERRRVERGTGGPEHHNVGRSRWGHWRMQEGLDTHDMEEKLEPLLGEGWMLAPNHPVCLSSKTLLSLRPQSVTMAVTCMRP